MSQYSPLMQILLKTVRAASKGLVRDFGELEHLQISKKGTNDFVTSSDLRTENFIYESLSQARPEYGFLMEESGERTGSGSEYRFIVDPLDGTVNFMHALPYFAVSVAVEQRHSDGRREIVAGVTHAPILRETYWAEKGKGAFVENEFSGRTQRLRVGARKELGELLVGTASLYRCTEEHRDLLGKLMGAVSGFRSMGCSTLDMAYFASGKYDAFLQHGIKYWDMAVGLILAQEAGAVLTDIHNKKDMIENATILSANDVLHAKIRRHFASSSQ